MVQFVLCTIGIALCAVLAVCRWAGFGMAAANNGSKCLEIAIVVCMTIDFLWCSRKFWDEVDPIEENHG